MATIWKSRGPVNSTDEGTMMSLPEIERRLPEEKYKLFYMGDAPKGMMPVTKYYTHIVIEVSSLDDLTPRFKQTGFYKVTGLQVPDAGFLFEPEQT
jgi:hypothetical protein